jgi:PPOX class probable F420-dependent enzyme
MEPSGAAPVPSSVLEGAAVQESALVRALLAERLVAVLATLDPDGAPHVVPVWFAERSGQIVLATSSRSRKIRNLERDARATLCVHDSRPGAEVCGASLRGRAEIVRGAAAETLVELVHDRYVTPAGAKLPAVGEFLSYDDVAVVFTPEAAWTWDERDNPAAEALRASGEARPLVPTAPRAADPEMMRT